MNDSSRTATYFRVKSRTGKTLVFSIINDVMRPSNSPCPAPLFTPYTLWQHTAYVFGVGIWSRQTHNFPLFSLDTVKGNWLRPKFGFLTPKRVWLMLEDWAVNISFPCWILSILWSPSFQLLFSFSSPLHGKIYWQLSLLTVSTSSSPTLSSDYAN